MATPEKLTKVSTMRIRMYETKQRPRWDELVEASSDATSGHLWQWREIVRAAYGFESFYLVAEESDGEAVAGLPFIQIRSRLFGSELTSMPYIDYGGVFHRDSLGEDQRERCDRELYNYALQLGKALRIKRLQVRSLRPADPRFTINTEKIAQHLALAPSASEQLKRLPAERRNRLRRSEKFGVTTEVLPPDAPGAFDEFCEIYCTNMRDLGSPSHSREFFRQTVQRFGDRLALFVIRHKSAMIAAALSFEYRGILALPFSGALLTARPVYGSNTLYWSAIRMAIEHGCHMFDFGRSSAGSGIFEFKRRWDPEPHQNYWSTLFFRTDAKAPRERKEMQLATNVWRHMPLAIARALGPSLRKGISN
jgi:FemAB-related protein (PEP-CTERM system-associated)